MQAVSSEGEMQLNCRRRPYLTSYPGIHLAQSYGYGDGTAYLSQVWFGTADLPQATIHPMETT
jgi:hypothetical protein